MGNTIAKNNFKIHSTNIKRALLIGFDYSGSNKLKGPLNDIKLAAVTLIDSYSFPISDVYSFTGGDLLTLLRNFINTSIEGDVNVIHYSGHGDYLNGTDALVREDLVLITGSQITELLVNAKGKFLFVIDACDSGEILDVPFSLKSMNSNIVKETDKQFSCSIVNFSSSARNQNSYESTKQNGLMFGDFTYDFYMSLSINKNYTWLETYKFVTEGLKNMVVPVLNCNDIKLYYYTVNDFLSLIN